MTINHRAKVPMPAGRAKMRPDRRCWQSRPVAIPRSCPVPGGGRSPTPTSVSFYVVSSSATSILGRMRPSMLHLLDLLGSAPDVGDGK